MLYNALVWRSVFTIPLFPRQHRQHMVSHLVTPLQQRTRSGDYRSLSSAYARPCSLSNIAGVNEGKDTLSARPRGRQTVLIKIAAITLIQQRCGGMVFGTDRTAYTRLARTARWSWA